jgi:hypothetical protein
MIVDTGAFVALETQVWDAWARADADPDRALLTDGFLGVYRPSWPGVTIRRAARGRVGGRLALDPRRPNGRTGRRCRPARPPSRLPAGQRPGRVDVRQLVVGRRRRSAVQRSQDRPTEPGPAS